MPVTSSRHRLVAVWMNQPRQTRLLLKANRSKTKQAQRYYQNRLLTNLDLQRNGIGEDAAAMLDDAARGAHAELILWK